MIFEDRVVLDDRAAVDDHVRAAADARAEDRAREDDGAGADRHRRGDRGTRVGHHGDGIAAELSRPPRARRAAIAVLPTPTSAPSHRPPRTACTAAPSSPRTGTPSTVWPASAESVSVKPTRVRPEPSPRRSRDRAPVGAGTEDHDAHRTIRRRSVIASHCRTLPVTVTPRTAGDRAASTWGSTRGASRAARRPRCGARSAPRSDRRAAPSRGDGRSTIDVEPTITRSIASCTRRSDSLSSELVASSRIEDPRSPDDRAGDRDTLALAAGQPHAALTDHGVVALRKLGDEIVSVGGPRRGDDVRIRQALPAVGDVVADRHVEEHGVLRHDAEQRAVARLAEPADVPPVDRHDRPAGDRRTSAPGRRASTCRCRSVRRPPRSPRAESRGRCRRARHRRSP